MNPETAKFYRDVGIELFKGYGLTETAPLICGDTLERFNPYCTGYAIPNVEIRIDGPDAEGTGEIVVKGQNVMQGYYKDGKATEEALIDGWFHTGDTGYIDKKGCVYITGRKKILSF